MHLPRLHTIDRGLEAFRRGTAKIRRLPDFVIIGAQKAGTSSLYNLLIRHPRVRGADRKEVHYFDTNFARGADWYRSRFPLGLSRSVTGEASPYYLYHPHAAARLRELLPEARLIALLRNPADRAYSHYQHNVRHGREPLSFEEALAREKERTAGELERLIADPCYYSFAHQHYSYVDRGHYQSQLAGFLRHFRRDQLLVLKSEEFFHSPAPVWLEVLRFLELDDAPLPLRRAYNVGTYSRLEGQVRDRLSDHFRPHNRQLAQVWGDRFDWS